jgi:hypothetical protein
MPLVAGDISPLSQLVVKSLEPFSFAAVLALIFLTYLRSPEGAALYVDEHALCFALCPSFFSLAFNCFLE